MSLLSNKPYHRGQKHFSQRDLNRLQKFAQNIRRGIKLMTPEQPQVSSSTKNSGQEIDLYVYPLLFKTTSSKDTSGDYITIQAKPATSIHGNPYGTERTFVVTADETESSS